MSKKEKKYHFVYKTKNKLNEKYYYGMHSTNNMKDGYLGSGKRLRYAIRKYGKENFELQIIEWFTDRKSLIGGEKRIITDEIVKDKNSYNIGYGGVGGIFNDEHKEKFIAGAKKGRETTDKILKERFGGGDDWRSKFNTHILKKLWQDDEYRKKHLENINWTGKKHSEETKNKMSEQRKNTGNGDKNSQFGTKWITNGLENKKIKKHDSVPDGWEYGRKIKR
jgi:hypothetical protein